MRSMACVGLIVVGSACSSSAAGMTCTEFATNEWTDRTAIVMDLIEAQGLDPASNPMAVALVEQDINGYCGISGIPGDTVPPSQNAEMKIVDAVNWASYSE